MGTRSAVKRFEELETIETRRLLLRILEKPEQFMDHIRKYVLYDASCYWLGTDHGIRLPGAIVLKLSYGYNIEPHGPDYMVDLADEVVKKIFSEASEPGRWLVDIIPTCSFPSAALMEIH